jgi:hypothetical protein
VKSVQSKRVHGLHICDYVFPKHLVVGDVVHSDDRVHHVLRAAVGPVDYYYFVDPGGPGVDLQVRWTGRDFAERSNVVIMAVCHRVRPDGTNEGERQRDDALAVFVVYFDLGHVETTPPGRYSKVSVSLSLFVVPKIVRGVTVVI